MASSGGAGYICEIIIGKGVTIFIWKYCGGPLLKNCTFLKTTGFPWDVINDRSLTGLPFEVRKDCLDSLFEQVGRRWEVGGGGRDVVRTKKFDKSARLWTKIVALYRGIFFCHNTSFVIINKWTQNIFWNLLLITLGYVHYVWLVPTVEVFYAKGLRIVSHARATRKHLFQLCFLIFLFIHCCIFLMMMMT